MEEGAVGTTGVDVPSRIEKLDASVGVKTNEDELTIDINAVSLRAAEPNVGINAMSGVIRRTPNELTFDNVAIRTEESALRVNGTVQQYRGPVRPASTSRHPPTSWRINELAKLFPALARLRAAAGVRGHGERARPIGCRSILPLS